MSFKKANKIKYLLYSLRGVSALLLLALAGAGARADTPEYQMKAAFIYNFAKLVEWPADAFAAADAPLNVCLLGNNPFGSALDAIAGRAADANRKVAVKRLAKVDEAKGCQIVFVSDSEKAGFAKIVDTLKASPVLTVSDAEGFTQAGGAIALVKADNKVAIKLNIKAAQQARLKLSPQLLRLATTE